MRKIAATIWFSWIAIQTPGSLAWAQDSLDLPVRIAVVGTGDFHGALEPKHAKVVDGREVGGIDIIAAYIQALRAADPTGVLLVDAGDLYQGTLLSAASEGKAVIEFYNDLGYEAAALGNHDFDFGPVGYHSTPQTAEDDPLGVLKLRLRQARFPFLSANISDRLTGEPVDLDGLQAFTIVEKKGVRVGLIGLSARHTGLITHPANVVSLDFKPLLSTVRRILPRIREQGATVIILVVHDGVGTDEDTGRVTGNVADLARALPPGEVDLIVAGHRHEPFSGRINGIPVIQTWPRGISFARADLVVDRKSGRVLHDQVVLHENALFFRTDRNGNPPTYAGRIIKPVARFVRKLERFKRSIAHLENVRLGRALVTLGAPEKLDSPVGNLVCDALRATDKSIDVAMYNSGGLRKSIPKGIITFGRIYEVVPFDSNLVTVTLTGGQVLRAIEHGLSAPYGVMEISGLKVVFDPQAAPGRRCVSLTDSSGKQVDDNRLYKVATNEFVLNGGDGYKVFARATNTHNTHTQIREVVANYIKKKGKLGPVQGGRYEKIVRTDGKNSLSR